MVITAHRSEGVAHKPHNSLDRLHSVHAICSGMSNDLTPLEVCERLIGKPEEVAEASGLHRKSAFPWRRASKWRMAGDLPSAKVMRSLLTHSTAHRLGLRAEHLIWGADEAEIEAILAERGSQPQGHPSPAPAGEGDAAPEFSSRRAGSSRSVAA